jgi:acetyltransferase-like isoleucine patch superfamily enzyme
VDDSHPIAISEIPATNRPIPGAVVAPDSAASSLGRVGMTETIYQAWLGIIRRLRRRWLRWRGVRMGRGCWIQAIEVPRNPRNILLGDCVALDANVVLLTTSNLRPAPRLEIGSSTYVNRFTMFDASDSIVVGERCMIGPSCYITDHDHGMQAGLDVASQALESAPVRIGNDVWIGAGVIILKGVAIGDGAVVGAGAVVTRDVPEATIAIGVPARSIASRQ